jgi:hypothetical protein
MMENYLSLPEKSRNKWNHIAVKIWWMYISSSDKGDSFKGKQINRALEGLFRPPVPDYLMKN